MSSVRFLALLGVIVACASTTTTASTARADEGSGAKSGAKEEVVCKTSSSDGVMELTVEWKGTSGKGSLKRVAPSGNVYNNRVRAERVGGTIIADDIHEKDLVVHAAVVREDKGKRYMRAGADGQPWLVCQ